MKSNLIKRALACVLTLAMLIPCLSMVPAAATDVTTAVDVTSAAAPAQEAVELFRWEAVKNVDTNMKKVKDNLILKAGSVGSTHKAFTVNLQGAQSAQDVMFHSVKEYSANTNNKVNFGLPRQIVGTGTNKYDYKATESLQLQFADFKPVSTQGLEAVNLKLTCGYAMTESTVAVHALDKFEVRVKVGGVWLEEAVGLRGWDLLGHGLRSDTKATFYAYCLESENLLNIDGLNPGDTIEDIMIRPQGEHYFSLGFFSMSDVTLKGYATQEVWETAVPNERTDLLDIGEQTMREIVLERARAIEGLTWTSDVPVYSESVSGQDYSGSGGTSVKEFIPGVVYHGTPYSRGVKTMWEQLREAVVDGVWVSGRTNGTIPGMDCTNFAYGCYSSISRSHSYRLWETQDDNSLVPLGDLKIAKNPIYTNLDIVNLNEPQAMYENYALTRAGDVLTTYTNAGGIHHRLANADAVVVRNPDGTIDPDKSVLQCIEQRGTIKYVFEAPDGSLVEYNTNSKTDLEKYMKTNPTYKLLYGGNTQITQYTFTNLRNTGYVCWTLKEYLSGKVENVDAQLLLHPTDYQDITKGFTGTVGADFFVVARGVTLEDLDQGKVLFEDKQYTEVTWATGAVYNSEELDAILAQLPDGDYRINLFVQTAGPVLRVGDDKPITTKSMDFTITGKESAEKVILEYSDADLAKGQSVEVYVKAGKDAEAADVTVSFDANRLDYTQGKVAAAGMKSVTCSGDEVHILCVNSTAGVQIAKLVFTAKEDGVRVSDAVELKGASVFTTVGGTTKKASGPRDVCLSDKFADVDADAWYHDAVDYVLQKGIMAGYGVGTFAPNDKLSRAMVVQVLYNKEGQPAVSGANKFPDVKAGDWFRGAVIWSANGGVVGGFGDGRFAPNQDVTIEEMAVILWNYAGKPAFTASADSVGAHSSWAANALGWAVENGILDNISYSAVTGAATRAQTAQMLMNLLEK